MMRGLILFRRQLHVISRSETSIIKPSSPTPGNLKQYNLSLHDRMMPNSYIPAIFFFANITSSSDQKSTIANLLKNSLSEMLSKYYPCAGRLRSCGSYVDCNDEGAQFVEAHIDCKLSHVLERAPAKEHEEGLGHLFPPKAIWDKLNAEEQSSLVLVQLNHFTCGGIAIAVSLSHCIGDAITFFSFISYWAGLSRHSGEHQKILHLRPHIVHELQPRSIDNHNITFDYPDPEKYWITKEIVFQNCNIAKLKASVEIKDKLQGLKEPDYTRNELVTALIYRCLVSAAATSNSGEYAKSFLCQMVNIRPMIDPPLPQTRVGNFIDYNNIPTSTESETELNLLVERIRNGRKQLRENKNVDENTAIATEFRRSRRIFAISSICNLPLYEMDFGWGRPVKATIVDTLLADCIILMDTSSGDGIKAIVSLEEQDMKNFLDNKDLLAYGKF
ncbi:acyltransferase-like [Apium graveolens]|uniref:acyltransferase-like n=1 Tax=Apium graveolens TaxID=4045 RepID=UPI003D7BBA5F